MPISKENAKRYPKNWPEIRNRVLARAGSRCEMRDPKIVGRDQLGSDGRCTRENGALIPCSFCDGSGRREVLGLTPIKMTECPRCEGSGKSKRRTVLTVAHLNHCPEHNDPSNLLALCQRCHNRYDQTHRQANAAKTREAKREGAGQGRLFGGGIE